MSPNDRSREFFSRLLAMPEFPNSFHPWRGVNADDAQGNNPEARLARLRSHLDIEAHVILVGEAPSYQGGRISGIAFTSERLVLEGVIPRVRSHFPRLSQRHIPWSEPSASIVWKTLYALKIAERTVCWNAFGIHPHLPDVPCSNRPPTPAERASGETTLRALIQMHPSAIVVAVGNVARKSLDILGIRASCVRHPAMGGATRFRMGLVDLLDGHS